MNEINTIAPMDISGTAPDNAGMYVAKVQVKMQNGICPTNPTSVLYMNVQSAVQSPTVVFNSTFVGYDYDTGILGFNIASWKPFQNIPIKLHIRIRFRD